MTRLDVLLIWVGLGVFLWAAAVALYASHQPPATSVEHRDTAPSEPTIAFRYDHRETP